MKLDASIRELRDTLDRLPSIAAEIGQASGLLLDCLRRGNKLLLAGNGGSAAEAQHFSTELVGRFKGNRCSLPAVSLTSDGTLMSCIANDFGWETVFVRQMEGLARPGDLVVVFSSSGNSADLVTLLHSCRHQNMDTIAFLGKGGGRCRGLASCEIIVPSGSTATVQEIHLFLIHHLCEQIELAFPPPA